MGEKNQAVVSGRRPERCGMLSGRHDSQRRPVVLSPDLTMETANSSALDELENPKQFPNIFQKNVAELESVAKDSGVVVKKRGRGPYKAELTARILMQWAKISAANQVCLLGEMITLCKSNHQFMLDFAENNDIPKPKYPEIKEHKIDTMQRIVEWIRGVELEKGDSSKEPRGATPDPLARRTATGDTKAPDTAPRGRRRGSDVDGFSRAQVLRALDSYLLAVAELRPGRAASLHSDTIETVGPIPAIRIAELEAQLDGWEDDIDAGEQRAVTEAERLGNIRGILRGIFAHSSVEL